MDVLSPPPSLLIKLGSIAVHIEEMFSPDGHEFDRDAVEVLLVDPEVQEWLTAASALALLPVKRELS